MSANRRRRRRIERERARRTTESQKQQNLDPRGVNSAIMVGVRNDGTPFVDVVGQMDLFQMTGAIEYARFYIEDIWADKIEIIKEKFRKEQEELAKQQAQQESEQESESEDDLSDWDEDEGEED